MSHVTEDQMNQAVQKSFQKYDKDKSGYLQRNQLMPMIQDALHYLNKNRKVDMQDVQNFLIVADKNKNGKLDRPELQSIFKLVVQNYLK